MIDWLTLLCFLHSLCFLVMNPTTMHCSLQYYCTQSTLHIQYSTYITYCRITRKGICYWIFQPHKWGMKDMQKYAYYLWQISHIINYLYYLFLDNNRWSILPRLLICPLLSSCRTSCILISMVPLFLQLARALPAQRTRAHTRVCVSSSGRASPATAPWPLMAGRAAVTVSTILHSRVQEPGACLAWTMEPSN